MILKAVFGLLLIALVPFSTLADVADDARKPVDRLNEALVEVMKGGKQFGYQGRYRKLEPVVKDVFQFEAVSQIALGSHWKALDTPQKAAFVAKLTDLSTATYAAQFKEYGGEAFKFDSSQELKGGRMLLRYQLTAPKEKPIKFEYIVGELKGEWQIINIIVDGISDLALKRAQYESVIDREGFDSLLNKLTQKIADYAKSNGAAAS